MCSFLASNHRGFHPGQQSSQCLSNQPGGKAAGGFRELILVVELALLEDRGLESAILINLPPKSPGIAPAELPRVLRLLRNVKPFFMNFIGGADCHARGTPPATECENVGSSLPSP